MKQYLLIAVGGSAGALARYSLSKFMNHLSSGIFPWGTFFVNITGSFLIGLLFDLFDRSVMPPELKGLIMIGFLGAYTTFSTFSLETLNLLRDGELKLALINILGSTVLGLMAVVAGIYSSRLLMKAIR